jgi:hypothetical protein
MDYQAHLYRHFWRSGALAERRPEISLMVCTKFMRSLVSAEAPPGMTRSF